MVLIDRVAAWRAAGRQAEERLARRAARLGRAGMVVPVVATLVAFSALALVTPHGLANGDAAVYAEQIEQRAFDERSVHIGYTVVAGLLLGLPETVSDRGLNLVSALFSAATVGMVARAAIVITGRLPLGALAAAATLVSWTFARDAALAEVHAGQVFFLVLAAWSWVRGRAAVAGVALAVSVLHTPSSLFAVPAFAVVRPDLRRLVTLGAVGGGITLAVLAGVWQDYFHGPRGLLAATSGGLSLSGKVVKEGVEVLFGVFALLPLALLGGWRLLRRRRDRPAAVGFVVLWAVTFVLGERFADVPVQLPTWTALSLISALGAAELIARLRARGARRSLWLAATGAVALLPLGALAVVRGRSSVFAQVSDGRLAAMALLIVAAVGAAAVIGRRDPRRAVTVVSVGLLAAGLLLVATLASAERAKIDDYRRDVLALRPVFTEDDAEALAAAGWSRAILFERYLFGASYTGRAINAEWWSDGGDAEGERARRHRDRVVAAGYDIWLLDAFPEIRTDLEAVGYRFSSDGAFWRGVRASTTAEPVTQQQTEGSS
ncbi:MAG: hypothetical protein AAGE94_12045 [Acidobacteriota bacterium]